MFRAKFPHGARISVGSKLLLQFKRFIYDENKRMEQSGIIEKLQEDAIDTALATDNESNDKIITDNNTTNTATAVPISTTEQQPKPVTNWDERITLNERKPNRINRTKKVEEDSGDTTPAAATT